MNNKFPELIFVTGVIGSMWTALIENVQESGEFNITDRNSSRQFVHHGKIRHLGVFFGRDQEYKCNLDYANLVAPFRDKDGSKIVKAHEWALMLDEIKEKYPSSWIWLIYRPNDVALNWWNKAGGHDIVHPINGCGPKNFYDSQHEVAKQNEAIMEFGLKHNAVWYHNTPKFYQEVFGINVNLENLSANSSILNAVIK
jgi:hypothetical protein